MQDRYYQEKLELDPRDPASIRQAVGAYMAGLNWVMEYYYRGVVSWVWYYPFHYSPMVSDMTDLQDLLPSFERGQPFTPFQQLLAVLPSASHKLLPKPYQVSSIPETVHAVDSKGGKQHLLLIQLQASRRQRCWKWKSWGRALTWSLSSECCQVMLRVELCPYRHCSGAHEG